MIIRYGLSVSPCIVSPDLDWPCCTRVVAMDRDGGFCIDVADEFDYISRVAKVV